MKNISALFFVVLFVTGCASDAPPHTRAFANCVKEVAGCQLINGACVVLTYPDKATCDSQCRVEVLKQIQSTGVSATYVRDPPGLPEPNGCVGFRTDLGGTAQGAQCLARALGYRFDPNGCNANGWAFSVISR